MSLLVWTAVLVGAWCAASALAALVVGPALRRRVRARSAVSAESVSTPMTTPAIATILPRPRLGDLDPLDTGPMRMWLAELPETPEPRRPSTSPAT